MNARLGLAYSQTVKIVKSDIFANFRNQQSIIASAFLLFLVIFDNTFTVSEAWKWAEQAKNTP
jgi:hypothetical protein